MNVVTPHRPLRGLVRSLFRGSANRAITGRLHGTIAAASRNPALYTQYAIADSLDGRFESFVLHAALVLRQLNAMPAPAPELAQDLADAIFQGLDATLREMGVGDVAVPKRMKKLAEAFLGRSFAYDQALRGAGDALAAALARNVYAGAGDGARLARYVEAVRAKLEKTPFEDFARGVVAFPDPASIS